MASPQAPLPYKNWRQLLSRRPDILGREQGQAIVRLGISSAVLVYLVIQHYPLHLGQELPSWLVFLAAFLVFSALIAGAALRDQRSSPYRRTIANVADVTAITFLMATTEEAGVPLFVLFLWVTLGNGFRFGLAAMGISTALSVAGFAVVVAISESWRAQESLAAGVMIALVVLPAYAAHLIRQLHKAREHAEQASAAKSQFLARMSHELRTPLNGIVGATELLFNRRRATEDHDLLKVIQDSTAVLLRQIGNVLDFSKIEAGKLIIDQTDFDLHQLVNGVAGMVRPASADKNLRFIVGMSPEAPFALIGDPHHLREILLNLLSNAIKFTATGYVAMEVEKVGADEQQTWLRFEIRDTGVGMAPEALERIWTSFEQENAGTTRRFGGTGLGTTIAKQLVELMGGRIDVASIKGRGTTFWFELPFRRQVPVGKTNNFVHAPRVLLLADRTESAEHLQRMLDDANGKVMVVQSVADAIAALGRGIRLGNPWHAVLVEEHMDITAQGARPAAELSDKALLIHAPVYLLTDTLLDAGQLCEWGYAAALRPRPTREILLSAIHASPHYDPQPAAAARVVKVEPWAWGQGTKAPRRLLIADDNRTNQLILQQILQAAGYEVDVASDGEVALERLLAGDYKAAVLDIHMPGLDGVELLRQYAMLCPDATVPLIMLTADMTFDAKRDCAEAGADAFLTKPVKADELLATLEYLVQERATHVLASEEASATQASLDDSVLDLSMVGELDRMSRDPSGLVAVAAAFEAEGNVLLERIAEAVATRNHSAFIEWVHELKAHAATVGALQLVALCRRAASAAVLEFRRDGTRLQRELNEHFSAAQLALHELAPSLAKPEQSAPV